MPKYGFKYYKENNYAPKHITVDIGTQTTAKTGAVMSSRQVIDVVDEKGEKVRGFFTENETVNAKQLFTSRAKQIKTPKGHEALGNIANRITETYAADPDGMRHFVVFLYKNTQLDFDSDFDDRQKADYELFIPKMKQWLTTKFSVPAEDLADFGKDEKVNDYVKSVFGAAFSAFSLEKSHTDHQLQQKGTNINRRNTAMSDCAELLGIPDTVAKSTSMTVINGDNIMHGSFMVNAQGVSYEHLMKETNPKGVKDITLTPSAYKELSNMQVLDFLCGNIDRHAANLFYKLDTSDPFEVKIVGVQGIDNDASFGRIDAQVSSQGKVYDRMSLIEDIKVMDKALADKIKNTGFDTFETKFRLAGLSKQEISAAYERFEMVKSALAMDEIRVIENDDGWEALSTSRREKRNIITTGAENVAFMGQNLPNDHPFKYMSNIFGMAESIVNQYNNAALHRKNKAAQSKDNEAGIKGTIPTGTAVNIVDSHALADHIDGLSHIRDEYKELTAGKAENAEFEPVVRELDAAVALMRKYSGKETLTDNERNLLSETLKELGESAGKYVENKPAELGNAEYHAAKNITAYASFAREAIRRDAIEAEMNAASKGADDIRREHGIAPTGLTYEGLQARVKGISGRCTPFFTNMMTSFEGLANVPAGMSDKNKKAFYDQAIRNAKDYIRHKMPNGSMAGLKKKEIARVKFARDLIEYTEAQKELIREKAEKAKQIKQERDDYSAMSFFHAKCVKLVEDYKGADTSDKKRAATDAVLLAKKEFVKDYEAVLAISDKYPPKHDMQAACGAMLSGGVADYMKICLTCYNDRTMKNETDVNAVLGIDDALAQKADTVIANGKKILDDYRNKQARSAHKPKDEEIKGMEEKVPGLE